jgi:hypothetical protein
LNFRRVLWQERMMAKSFEIGDRQEDIAVMQERI